ncbi:MAG: SGNH/GDSL hydrolase family protein [Clostridia bacterium]|nr:SGNH/GDSL hydrolase family protein [Clostridia bacterium]
MLLKNKTVLFLGSSVTYGGGNYSFADVMAERCGINCIKEAVSGTTLADRDKTSYVSRLKTVDSETKVDLFICQLSTNDAALNIPLSEVEEAIRFIVEYVQKTFACKVAFYTGTYFENENYRSMVSLLLSLQKEYGFSVLDMYNDVEMRAVGGELYKKYMSDPVHPTSLGYIEWWTPKFIDFCEKL